MEDKVLLDVQGLKTYFHTFKGVVKAVDNVSFSLKEGEILGIVGLYLKAGRRSGCG